MPTTGAALLSVALRSLCCNSETSDEEATSVTGDADAVAEAGGTADAAWDHFLRTCEQI